MSKERPKLIEILRKIARELRSEKYISDVGHAVASGTKTVGYVMMGVGAITEFITGGAATPVAAAVFEIGEGLVAAGGSADSIVSMVDDVLRSYELQGAQDVINRDHELSKTLHDTFVNERFQFLKCSVFSKSYYVQKEKLDEKVGKLFKTAEKLPILKIKAVKRVIDAAFTVKELTESIIRLNEGSSSKAADALDREAEKMEVALENVNEQLNECRESLLHDLKDCLTNMHENWADDAAKIMSIPIDPMVNLNTYGMTRTFYATYILKPLIDWMGPVVKEENQNHQRHDGAIDLAFVSHGSIGRPFRANWIDEAFRLIPVIILKNDYFLTESLQSITFYQAWGSMLHSNAAYRILTKTIDCQSAHYFEGQVQSEEIHLGDTFMAPGGVPDTFNTITPEGENVHIPTVWLHPTPEHDPLLQVLRRTLQLWGDTEMLYFWNLVAFPIPACAVTHAMSLIARVLQTNIKLHMVCCLGPGDISVPHDLNDLLSITQYCNLVEFLNIGGRNGSEQIWMATGDNLHP